MKKGNSRKPMILQSTMALFLSLAVISGTTATGLLSIFPSQYQQNVFAQECSFDDPFGCFGEDDQQASTEDVPADITTPDDTSTPADTATPDDTSTPADTGAVSSQEAMYCDPSQHYCYPTDIIVDSSGQVTCDGTQYDCSAYSGESPSSDEVQPLSDNTEDSVTPGTCDPSTQSCEPGSTEVTGCDPTIASCPQPDEQVQYLDPVSIPDGPDTVPGQRVQVTQQECTTITHTSDAKGKACRAYCWGAGAGCAAAACLNPAAPATCIGIGIVCGVSASLCSDACTGNFPPETTTTTTCTDVAPPNS
jgi:hypothetical protein